MQVDLDELEAKFADKLHGPTCDELYRIAPSLIAELREARKTIAGTCHQVVSLAENKRVLEAEVEDLRDEVKTFLVLWAARYSEMQGLGGAFHPQHFDRLKELGVRMDDFRRADLQPVKETP